MWVVADVVFDTDEDAREAERLVREDKLAGVSVDVTGYNSEIEIRAVDEDGFPTDWLETGTAGEIVAATITPMRAFEGARIEFTPSGPVAWLVPEGEESSDRRMFRPGSLTWREGAELMWKDFTSSEHDGAVYVGNLRNFRRVGDLVASSDPHLAGLTKPMVRDGKIVGHGAGWGTCHTAFRNACVTAPSSTYKHCEDGVGIYRHPNGDIHAPLGLNLEEARRWYDAHCELVGRAGVGEDPHGIWVSGDTTLDDGDLFLSGDWRVDDGDLELISFLVVDKPGFPTAMVAADTQTALTSAGIVRQSDTVIERLARLEAVLFPRPFQVDAELEEFWETESLLSVFEAD